METASSTTVASTEASASVTTDASVTPVAPEVTIIQGTTEVSENDLRGITPSTGSTPAVPESKPDVKSDDGVKPVVSTEPADKTEDKADDKATTKPPKGFVPVAAVHEVRGENKYLKEQIAALTAQVNAVKAAPVEPVVPSEFESFKELTDAEFDALTEDQPAEALKYIKAHGKYQDYTRKVAEAKQAAEAYQEYQGQVFATTSAEMEKHVPGILDPESPVAQEFRDFAIDLGFDEDMFYLTNPATQIILPGETTPSLLGEQAASIIKMLAAARTKINAKVDTGAPDIEKIKAGLRAELEAEIVAKVKAGTPFRSLSSMPDSSSETPSPLNKVLSPEDFASLTEKEQEAYLAGQ